MCRVALCGLWWLYCCAVVSSVVCLLCRLWVHALAVFNIYICRAPHAWLPPSDPHPRGSPATRDGTAGAGPPRGGTAAGRGRHVEDGPSPRAASHNAHQTASNLSHAKLASETLFRLLLYVSTADQGVRVRSTVAPRLGTTINRHSFLTGVTCKTSNSLLLLLLVSNLSTTMF